MFDSLVDFLKNNIDELNGHEVQISSEFKEHHNEDSKYMAVALAGQLREGTKKSHTMAENTGFVACFLKGVVEKKSYRKLISDLYFVYEAMEEEIERLVNEEHPVIKPIGFKSLFRKETLVNDLKFYFGENWKNEINISHSAKEYVERIREVAKNSPELLVGHHYTRYIGDLSGGQILKRIAKKALNLQGNDGLNFYEFELIADEKKFKEEYSCLLYTSPSPRDMRRSRMPSSA